MGGTTEWKQAQAVSELKEGDVHVWQTSLKQPDAYVEDLFATLSAEEQAKARRFRFPHLQAEYTVGRGVLRELLGQYLNVSPASIEFAYGPQGKPMLGGVHADSGLSFNVSHSGELALYAFTRGREVGVDIEHMKPMDDAESIAEHFFAPQEIKRLLDLPQEQRNAAFFNCWSRKEAFIKVSGKGVSYGLDKFAVTLGPDEPARLLWVEGEDEQRFELRALEVAGPYKAALCVEGVTSDVLCWKWR